MAILFLSAVDIQAQAEKSKPSDYGIKSKKALGLFLDGKQQAMYRSYPDAIRLFQQAIQLESGFGEAFYQMGCSHYAIHEFEEGYAALQKAKELLKEPVPMFWFYHAECAFKQDAFGDAASSYDKFLKSNPAVPKGILVTAERNKKSADFAAKAMMNPVKFNPINLGDSVNTEGEEYLPNLTADGSTIFFTSRRPGSTGGYNREYRDYAEDFYFCEKRNGTWGEARNLGEPINTELNEGAPSFSPDGQFVFFAACHRKDGYGDCDLYMAKLNGNQWSAPQNLGPVVNSPAWESQPCISTDGKTLYFSSTRPGGEGGQDIWYSKLEKGRWSAPTNMGKPVNTPGSDLSPFLHADGHTLYFSSDFHPGFGGLDLFMSHQSGTGWSEPQNLGFPLNTSAGEGNIFVTTKGDSAYMNSSRKGGKGRSDLYVFELDQRLRPSFTTYVRGFVTERGTRKPLDAKVVFVNRETGDTIRSVQTNSASGKYLLTLPLEQNYAAFIDKKGYLYRSEEFSLKNIDPERTPYFDVNIELEPLQVGVEMIMKSVYFETNKFNLLPESTAELDFLVNFMKKNANVKVEIGGHTDHIGAEKDNEVLAGNRALAVRDYLVKKGIPETRVTSKGYGEREPIATNDTPEGRALNRRTVCRIVGI